MIQLTNMKHLCPRKDAELQSGYDQDIYRVLAIAQTEKSTLYTAAEVIRYGWSCSDQKDAYQKEYAVLYAWANKKNITLTSHNMDEAGNMLKPAKWKGEGWQSEVAHKLWNRAAEIFNGAMELRAANEEEGKVGLCYWYDSEFGSFAVRKDQQALVIQIANKKYAAEKEAKEKSKPADETWKNDLKQILYPPESDGSCARLVKSAPVVDLAAGMIPSPIPSLPAKKQTKPEDLADLITHRVREIVESQLEPKRPNRLQNSFMPGLAIFALSACLTWFFLNNSASNNSATEEISDDLPHELSISDATILTATIQKKATSRLPLKNWEHYSSNWVENRLVISPENSEHQKLSIFINNPVILASLP